MPLEFACNNEEKIVGITVNPTTQHQGLPTSIDPGSLAIATVSGDGTGVIEADGTISVLSGSVAGDSVFNVTADGQVGPGEVVISDLITLHVAGANAAVLGLGGGTVVPK